LYIEISKEGYPLKICKICVKNDILCSACGRKLEKGEISHHDVKISRFLDSIYEGASFLKSFEAGGKVYVIVNEPDMGKIIGKSGKNVKKLGEMLGKDVKVLQKEDEKRMIEKAFNVPVNGINKVYGQNEFYRVRIDKKAKRKFKEGFGSAIESIIGSKAEIVFE
jgi:transcription antitermination factor NusA-like protein